MAEDGAEGRGGPFGYDVASAGLASAAAVVERMLELGRAAASGLRFPLPSNGDDPLGGVATGQEGNGSHRTDPGPPDVDRAERNRQARRFRADAERLVELYADFTRLLLDGATAMAEQAAQAPSTNGRATNLADPGVLVLGPASPGATTTATAWLHVLDGPAAAPAIVHATDLVAHDGTRVPAQAVTCAPAALDTTAPRTSTEVRVSATVPAGVAPGAYHGHLLATGLPEVVLPIRIEVVP